MCANRCRGLNAHDAMVIMLPSGVRLDADIEHGL
jgi:hypothetical protein